MFDVIISSVVPSVRAFPAWIFHHQVFKESAVGSVSVRDFPPDFVSHRVLVGNRRRPDHLVDRIAVPGPGCCRGNFIL